MAKPKQILERSRWLLELGGAMVAGAALICVSATAQAAQAPTPTPTSQPDGGVNAGKAATLAQRILTILRGASGASQSYLMGRIQAEVDASGSNCGTAKAALAQVPTAGLSVSAAGALAGAAGSASLCAGLGTGGTGGVNAPQTTQQSTTLGLPGGSSNYQQ